MRCLGIQLRGLDSTNPSTATTACLPASAPSMAARLFRLIHPCVASFISCPCSWRWGHAAGGSWCLNCMCSRGVRLPMLHVQWERGLGWSACTVHETEKSLAAHASCGHMGGRGRGSWPPVLCTHGGEGRWVHSSLPIWLGRGTRTMTGPQSAASGCLEVGWPSYR